MIGWRFDPSSKDYAREALLEWREQQRAWKERKGEKREELRQLKHSNRELREMGYTKREIRDAFFSGALPALTIEDRIRRVQRQIVGGVGTLMFLSVINAMTSPHFPWVIFPAIGIVGGMMARVTSLWMDGVSPRRLLQGQPRSEPGASSAGAPPVRAPMLGAPTRSTPPDLSGVPRDVLEGPHGPAIREAAEAKALITDVLAKLPPNDRQILPDILPTVDSLNERVRSLAQGLHQLDQDASAEAIARLDARIATAKQDGADSAERTRRIELLERQRSTLTDLAQRRDTVAQQLESASMVLQTMKLDLLKLRSSGLDAMLDNSVGATQEARALSTDIGRVIDAANEVRKL